MLGQIGPRSEAGEGEGEPAHISLCLGEGICIFCGVEGLVWGSDYHGQSSPLGFVCIYLYVCVNGMCRCPQRPEPMELGLQAAVKCLVGGAGNQTQID